MPLICSVTGSWVEDTVATRACHRIRAHRYHESTVLRTVENELIPLFFGYILTFLPTCSKTEPFDTFNTTSVLAAPIGDKE